MGMSATFPATALPFASVGSSSTPADHRNQTSCHCARVLPKAVEWPGTGGAAAGAGAARHRATRAAPPAAALVRAEAVLMSLLLVIWLFMTSSFLCVEAFCAGFGFYGLYPFSHSRALYLVIKQKRHGVTGKLKLFGGGGASVPRTFPPI